MQVSPAAGVQCHHRGVDRSSDDDSHVRLNLGWLVVLVVTVALPLVLDAVGRLTYFTSLALWGNSSFTIAALLS